MINWSVVWSRRRRSCAHVYVRGTPYRDMEKKICACNHVLWRCKKRCGEVRYRRPHVNPNTPLFYNTYFDTEIKMTTYTITIKVQVRADFASIAHAIATQLCDTIGYGKAGEVIDVYSDRVEKDATENSQ